MWSLMDFARVLLGKLSIRPVRLSSVTSYPASGYLCWEVPARPRQPYEKRCLSRNVAYVRKTQHFSIGIRIYPGTELECLARQEGVLTLASKEMLTPVFYISPTLDQAWLIKELHEATVTHMNYINTDSIGLPWLSSIHRLGYRLGIKPPLWKHTGSIRYGLRFLGIDV